MTKGAFRIFCALLKEHGVPLPEPEYRFHPQRRWRFDAAWPAAKLALEQDGGIFTGGRHVRGAALLEEHRKMNEAAILGWRVLRTTPSKLLTMETVDMVRRALAA